jgi:hypothetical protein
MAMMSTPSAISAVRQPKRPTSHTESWKTMTPPRPMPR